MPRYLLLSCLPKMGHALALAKTVPDLQIDGIASPDAVLVKGEDSVISALLKAYPGRLVAERVVELEETTEVPPLPRPSFVWEKSTESSVSQPPEPPLPPSFRFA